MAYKWINLDHYYSRMMMTTKWGIIGPGNIAHDFAKDLELLSAPQQIKAVLGNSPETTENFAGEFSIPNTFYNLQEFVERAGVDIVYVATPHTLHHEQVLACLNNKIPVLCEKPMTINAAQCNELIAASQQNNTFLMEGMWIRFLPSIKLLLEQIQSGKIGKVISVKASMSFKAPHDPQSRYFDPVLGGGSLLDLGIYPVFLATLILGKPGIVKAIGTLSPEGVDEDCSVLFHYKTGQHAILESSLLAPATTPAEITGEKGTISILNPWFEKAAGLELHVHDEGKIIYPCPWPGKGLHFEAEEAIACINNNKIYSDLMTHDFSRDMITVMDEIRNQVKVTYDMFE